MTSKNNLKEKSNINSKIVNNIVIILTAIIAIPLMVVASIFSLQKIEEGDNTKACDIENIKFTELSKVPVEIKTEKYNLNYQLELADSEEKREFGLMCRKYLSENSGMLFVFDNISQRSFWMKNTIIPLDMIFLDEEKRIITIYQNVTPLRDDLLYPSKFPAKYAIELKAGQVEKYQINLNSNISF